MPITHVTLVSTTQVVSSKFCALRVLAMSRLGGTYRCMCSIVEQKEKSRVMTTNPKRKKIRMSEKIKVHNFSSDSRRQKKRRA